MVMMEWFRRTISNFDHNDNSQESEEHVVFDIFQFSFKSWIICKSTIIPIKICIVHIIEYFFINKKYNAM